MDPFAFADIAGEAGEGADDSGGVAQPAVAAAPAAAQAPAAEAPAAAAGAGPLAAAEPAAAPAAAATNPVETVAPAAVSPPVAGAATTPNAGMWTPASIATLQSTAAPSSAVLPTSSLASLAAISSSGTPAPSSSSLSATSSMSSSSPSPTPTVTEKDVGKSGWALPVVIPIACAAGFLLALSIAARMYSIMWRKHKRRKEAAAALARKLDHEGGDPDDSTAELAPNMDISGARFHNGATGSPARGGVGGQGGGTPSRFGFGSGRDNRRGDSGQQEAETGYNDAELLGVPSTQPQGAAKAWSWMKNTFTNQEALGEQNTRGPPAKKSILSFVNLAGTPASPPGFSLSDDPWRRSTQSSVSHDGPPRSAATHFGWCDVSLSPPPPTPPPKFNAAGRKAPPPRSPLSTVTEERSLGAAGAASMASSPSRMLMSTVGKGVVRSPAASSPLSYTMNRDGETNANTSSMLPRPSSNTYRRVSKENDGDDGADAGRLGNMVLREEDHGFVERGQDLARAVTTSQAPSRKQSTRSAAPLRRATTLKRPRFDSETVPAAEPPTESLRAITPAPPYESEETPHARSVINFNYDVGTPGPLSPHMPIHPAASQLHRNATSESEHKRRRRLGRAKTIVDNAVQASNAERLKRAASAAPGARARGALPVTPVSVPVSRTSTTTTTTPTAMQLDDPYSYHSTRGALQVESPMIPIPGSAALTRRSSGSQYSSEDGVPSLSDGESDDPDRAGSGLAWRTPATSVRRGDTRKTMRRTERDVEDQEMMERDYEDDGEGDQVVFAAASKALLATPFAESARSTPKYLDAIAAYYSSPNVDLEDAPSPYGVQPTEVTQTRSPLSQPPRIQLHDGPAPLPSPYESRSASPTRGMSGSPTRQWAHDKGRWTLRDAENRDASTPAAAEPSPFGRHAGLFFSPAVGHRG
ncbi:hypothetical protein BDZ90DRAFT_260132 [Jaminaea rosea]|uniref:Uncharacterized protein n=1 Tax=Jaminaea rosea TaxID=1569628 RepID=A0A316UWZ3_9BASI|nr:hypothetical protein BDZ90DRAFT_260132 [Jaminaea rosea]PWN27645.1 hypothetical protein BDZ90DRAFT_260132 [Jaminaea rosea]